uniref:Uncharacterized protein n=2 Tax=Oryza sativa subsp. japonica TaxID=39947 RepID=Q10N15_ORYSJ|nr:Hypothetical protein [Oryza sativa Japonica Group]ABF95359.1 hypothetical protein LOC_Os03g17750 [Oryza sativa Japonica Group]
MDSGGDKEDGKEEDGSNVHGKGKGEDISNLKDGSIMDNGGQNSGSIFRERGFFYSIYPEYDGLAQDTTVVESVQSQDSLALKLHVVPEALIAPTRQIKRRASDRLASHCKGQKR